MLFCKLSLGCDFVEARDFGACFWFCSGSRVLTHFVETHFWVSESGIWEVNELKSIYRYSRRQTLSISTFRNYLYHSLSVSLNGVSKLFRARLDLLQGHSHRCRRGSNPGCSKPRTQLKLLSYSSWNTLNTELWVLELLQLAYLAFFSCMSCLS